MQCVRCSKRCDSGLKLTAHMLSDHQITVSFSCLYKCGYPKVPRLGLISAHMKTCPGRTKAMLDLLPPPSLIDETNRLSHPVDISEHAFRVQLLTDAFKLSTSNFKSSVINFLGGKANLNDLESTFQDCLPDLKRKRKRGKKRRKKSKPNPGHKPPDLNKTRATEYAKLQDLWYNNKKRLWEYIKKGHTRSETEGNEQEFFGYFASTFSRMSPCSLGYPTNDTGGSISIARYITFDDVYKFIIKKHKSSPGPDGIRAQQITPRIDEFLVLLNCCILAGDIPDEWRESTTNLIPKKDHSSEPSDHRPITISSIMYRCFSAVLSDRINESVKLTHNQKGFIKGDGIHEAISTVRFLLKHKSNTRIAALDVAKAFDSISQESIFIACKLKGLDNTSINLLRSLYRNCTTRITLNGIESDEIHLLAGVKQGDPLSPVLFNIVMDQLLEQLNLSNLGVELGATNISGLAYADDLALAATTDRNLQQLIDLTSDILSRFGLKLDGSKCFVLNTDQPIRIGDCDLQKVSSIKYLGVDIDSTGDSRTFASTFIPLLQKISSAHLKPTQKLYLMRQHLIPMYLHRLIHEDFVGTSLEEIDRIIRRNTKDFLHLVPGTTNFMIHLKVKNGGLGIPQLLWVVPTLAFKRLRRLTTSKCPFVHYLSTTKEFQNELKRISILAPYKLDYEQRLINECTTNPANRGHLCFTIGGNIVNKHLSGWTGISGRNFVSLLRLRSGTLGAINGAPNQPTCHRCLNGQLETLAHILNQCKETKGLQTLRHNRVRDLIFETLLAKKWSTVREAKIPITREEYIQPDLIAVNPERTQAYCFDVRVSYEMDKDSLPKKDQSKRDKYSRFDNYILDYVNHFMVADTPNILYYGLIFGARESIHSVTLNLLKEFGFSDLRIGAIIDRIIFDSLDTYRLFHSGTSSLPNSD